MRFDVNSKQDRKSYLVRDRISNLICSTTKKVVPPVLCEFPTLPTTEQHQNNWLWSHKICRVRINHNHRIFVLYKSRDYEKLYTIISGKTAKNVHYLYLDYITVSYLSEAVVYLSCYICIRYRGKVLWWWGHESKTCILNF